VTLRATLGFGRDVALDGEGNLTLDLSNRDEDVIIVSNDAVVGLYGITVTGGTEAGIRNDSGRVALVNSTVSGNGDGIHNNDNTMTLIGVTVSDNTCSDNRLCTGVGISNRRTMTLVNCTVSDNDGGAIRNFAGVHGQGLSVLNSTASGAIDVESGMVAFTNTLIDGTCAAGPVVSNGYNIESPGNTCGFDQPGDQPRVSEGQLNLQPLADNGGPTETHALGVGSVAIDQIPEAECVDAEGAPLTTDQRGFPRDAMCDVGAFEVQP